MAEGGHSPIIMVDRGTCKFVVKTKHIQDFGGIMAIIVDNIAWESVEREVMATDGTDVGITIPSFLIDYFEGEQLKQYVHANNATDELSDTDTEIFNI